LGDSSDLLIFHDGKIWGYLANREADDEEEEVVIPIVKGKHTTEFGKILELQKLIDKAKNLIFAAQDIDCTIDYPYCPEIENDDRNTESMGSELSIIRSYLEWMDNKCWSYQRLKK